MTEAESALATKILTAAADLKAGSDELKNCLAQYDSLLMSAQRRAELETLETRTTAEADALAKRTDAEVAHLISQTARNEAQTAQATAEAARVEADRAAFLKGDPRNPNV